MKAYGNLQAAWSNGDVVKPTQANAIGETIPYDYVVSRQALAASFDLYALCGKPAASLSEISVLINAPAENKAVSVSSLASFFVGASGILNLYSLSSYTLFGSIPRGITLRCHTNKTTVMQLGVLNQKSLIVAGTLYVGSAQNNASVVTGRVYYESGLDSAASGQPNYYIKYLWQTMPELKGSSLVAVENYTISRKQYAIGENLQLSGNTIKALTVSSQLETTSVTMSDLTRTVFVVMEKPPVPSGSDSSRIEALVQQIKANYGLTTLQIVTHTTFFKANLTLTSGSTAYAGYYWVAQYYAPSGDYPSIISTICIRQSLWGRTNYDDAYVYSMPMLSKTGTLVASVYTEEAAGMSMLSVAFSKMVPGYFQLVAGNNVPDGLYVDDVHGFYGAVSSIFLLLGPGTSPAVATVPVAKAGGLVALVPVTIDGTTYLGIQANTVSFSLDSNLSNQLVTIPFIGHLSIW